MSDILEIHDSHHVVRYCSPRCVDDEGINESAFRLRNGEQNLSVNWLEYFNSSLSIDEQMEKVRQILNLKLDISANGRIAKINVGKIRGCSPNLKVEHVPKLDDPSHAHIFFTMGADQEIAQVLNFADILQPHSEVLPAVA